MTETNEFDYFIEQMEADDKEHTQQVEIFLQGGTK